MVKILQKTHHNDQQVLSPSVPVLPPRYSSRLFRSSFTTCFSVIGAVRSELWGCALLALVVLLTSLNYWRGPVKGWRRTADMTAVFGAAVYHAYCCVVVCQDPVVQVLYAMVVANSGYCYMQARKAPNQDVSSAWHCGLHLLGNVKYKRKRSCLVLTGLTWFAQTLSMTYCPCRDHFHG